MKEPLPTKAPPLQNQEKHKSTGMIEDKESGEEKDNSQVFSIFSNQWEKQYAVTDSLR